jgi:multidrug efflux pump subunit AcrA (membrane-fusion protein)
MPEALALAPPKRQIGLRMAGLACFLGVALLGGCQQDEAKHQPLPVKVQHVRLVEFTPSATLSGEIAARVESDLSFRLSGRIVERKVEVGSHVEAGEVLAWLDPKVQEADV